MDKGQLLAELDARDLLARRDQAAAALASAARRLLATRRPTSQRKRELSAAQIIPAERPGAGGAGRGGGGAAARGGRRRASTTPTTQLGYTRIDAPIAGVVASISTQEGETVAASFAAPTFVTLLDLDRLEVWAYVDETDIGRIRAGQPARFTVDTYPDQEFEGRVTAIYPQAEIRDNVVNYVTVVRFEPPRDRTLRPEMTATVRIALDRETCCRPRRRAGGGAVVLPAANGRAAPGDDGIGREPGDRRAREGEVPSAIRRRSEE